MLNIYCEDFDFCDLARAFDGEIAGDCGISAEIIFIDGEKIRRLNRETRGVDAVTDVLSYPSLDGIKGKEINADDFPADLDENGCVFIGSIAICTARAREQAEEYGHSLERELNYLAVHGALHCLGYDHETEREKQEMREKEEEIMARMNLQRN